MKDIFGAAAAAIASGAIGAGIGGMLAFVYRGHRPGGLSFVMEFSGGMMTAVVCFSLMPDAIAQGGIFLSILGLMLGVMVTMMLEDVIISGGAQDLNVHFSGTAYAVMAAVGLHNFPEGLAIGSGYGVSVNLGLSLAFVIALHNIPEGLAIALPLRLSGKKPLKAMCLTALAEVPTVVGAVFGALVGKISPQMMTICISAAAGAMLYIVSADIIPESKRLDSGKIGIFGSILGMIAGIIACNLF
jgi:ZIP family zinc transporter